MPGDETPTDGLLTVAGRPAVRVERRFAHPIEKVWRAVTTPEHLGAWFPSPVQVDLRPGGAMRFSAFDGDAAADGTVEELDPPRRLAFTWGIKADSNDSSRVVIAIARRDQGTDLTLTHELHPDWADYAARTEAGWTTMLDALAKALG